MHIYACNGPWRQSSLSWNDSWARYVRLQFPCGAFFVFFCFPLHWSGEMLKESMTQCSLRLQPSHPQPSSILSIFNTYMFYSSPHNHSCILGGPLYFIVIVTRHIFSSSKDLLCDLRWWLAQFCLDPRNGALYSQSGSKKQSVYMLQDISNYS